MNKETTLTLMFIIIQCFFFFFFFVASLCICVDWQSYNVQNQVDEPKWLNVLVYTKKEQPGCKYINSYMSP